MVNALKSSGLKGGVDDWLNKAHSDRQTSYLAEFTGRVFFSPILKKRKSSKQEFKTSSCSVIK